MKKDTPIGKLSFREDGYMWHVFWTQPNTTEGAVLLGSIAIAIIKDQDKRKRFESIIIDYMREVIIEHTGETPDMERMVMNE